MDADRTSWRRSTVVEPAATANTAMLVERSVVLLLVGLLLLGVALVLRPFATAILFALILAVATWPLRLLLVRAGLSPRLAATLMSLGGLLAIGLPMLAIAPRLRAACRGSTGR